MAVMAAQESKLISKRVKDCHAILKQNGVKLGHNPRRMETATPKANEAWRAKGRLTVDKYGTLIVSLRDGGLSYQKVADKLNEMEFQHHPENQGLEAMKRSTSTRRLKARKSRDHEYELF